VGDVIDLRNQQQLASKQALISFVGFLNGTHKTISLVGFHNSSHKTIQKTHHFFSGFSQ
jgi:hypothetical protein